MAASFGEAGGGSALEQRETGERDDGRVNEESGQVRQGGFSKMVVPFIQGGLSTSVAGARVARFGPLLTAKYRSRTQMVSFLVRELI